MYLEKREFSDTNFAKRNGHCFDSKKHNAVATIPINFFVLKNFIALSPRWKDLLSGLH